jgi:PAS domain-containing protein
MHLAAQMAVELEEDRPEPVRDGERVGCDSGVHEEIVNEVNKCARTREAYARARVDPTSQKNLALILARQFASALGMPMFLTNADGRLVFYNEPAEELVGRTFAETGEISAREWTELLDPEALDGGPLAFEDRPSGIAFTERRPAHDTFRITTFDGRKREISVTALPLFAREDDFLGVLTMFWETG